MFYMLLKGNGTYLYILDIFCFRLVIGLIYFWMDKNNIYLDLSYTYYIHISSNEKIELIIFLKTYYLSTAIDYIILILFVIH